MSLSRIIRLSALAITTMLAVNQTLASDWTRFRGPGGQGIADSSVPVKWDKKDKLAWAIDLPGEGSSSPIVVGGNVFVTCYSESNEGSKRYIVCVDAKSGKKVWEDSVPGPTGEDSYRGYLTEHGFASGTPVSDGKNVYAFFGKAGVVAWDITGKKLWQKDVGQQSSNRRWGSAASLVLFEDVVIVNASEEAKAIIGLSAKDGKEVWKADYNLLELCYATPTLVKASDGVTEAVISMPGEVWGLNPKNGKLRWYCEIDNGGNVSPSVVVGTKAFYTFGGYPEQQTNAIKRGGRKDVTKSHRVWQSRDSTYVPTPVLFNQHLYWVTDKGQAISMRTTDGETVSRTRLKGLKSGGRPVYASPVKAGDHIYVVTRKSGTYVFDSNPKMNQVAKNEPLDDTDFNASPAVSDGAMYLRSNKALYCIR